MFSTGIKKWRKGLSVILAFLGILFLLLTVHRLAKLPEEPLWGSPALIWDNWQFALLLGLGLPYSTPMAILILLILFVVFYAAIRFVLQLFFR